jgi:hypothetical protein
MRLSEIRGALHVLAGDIEAKGMEAEARKLRTLAEETKRRPVVRRSAPRARPVTADLQERIRQTPRRTHHGRCIRSALDAGSIRAGCRKS